MIRRREKGGGRIVLLLLSVLSGCFSDWELGRAESLPETPDAGASVAVTIATYNVEKFDLGGDAKGQYAHVAAFAADAAVDILVLEEVQKDANGDDEVEFSAALDEQMYPMPYVGFSSMSDGFNALAVWSRFPLSDLEEILPLNTRSVYRFASEINGTRVLFFACHLKSGSDEDAFETRRAEAERLARYITAEVDLNPYPVVVLGDMNTMTDADFAASGTLQILTLSANGDELLMPVNWTNLPDMPTYPSTGDILDHILLSPSALSAYVEDSVEVSQPEGDGPFGPSDHYPLLLTLQL